MNGRMVGSYGALKARVLKFKSGLQKFNQSFVFFKNAQSRPLFDYLRPFHNTIQI